MTRNKPAKSASVGTCYFHPTVVHTFSLVTFSWNGSRPGLEFWPLEDSVQLRKTLRELLGDDFTRTAFWSMPWIWISPVAFSACVIQRSQTSRVIQCSHQWTMPPYPPWCRGFTGQRLRLRGRDFQRGVAVYMQHVDEKWHPAPVL